jgi:broad specificity phosphatase PhoE
VPALADERFDRIVASTHLRCIETVEPLAASRGLAIERDERLAEGKERAALELALSLLDEDVVLASHGDVIPAIVRAAGRDGVEVPNQVACDFASTWILTGRNGRFDTARYVGVG